jgi:hypothetical protein
MRPAIAILTISFFLNACSAPAPPAAAIDTSSPRWKICEEKCAAAKAGKVRIDISLASCTAQLLDHDGELLAEMDVSPGVPEHKTPAGSYYVREKLPVKNSNLYGQYVNSDTREVVVARAWEHKGKRPEGTVYQGIAMPFWLRLTDYGVGVHVGGFNRGQPSSHGCIRCPEPGQRVFWEMSRVGTPVRVHHGSHPAPSLLNPPPAESTAPPA